MITQSQFERARDLLKPSLIAVVVTYARGKVNIAPIAWHAISSAYERPWAVCMGLSNDSHSLANLRRHKEFVLAFPSRTQIKDVLWCGTVSGKSVDKAAATDLKFTPSRIVHPPLLQNAVLNLECKVMKSIKLESFTIMVSKIIEVHASTQKSFDKIYALGNERYGIVSRTKVMQKGRT